MVGSIAYPRATSYYAHGVANLPNTIQSVVALAPRNTSTTFMSTATQGDFGAESKAVIFQWLSSLSGENKVSASFFIRTSISICRSVVPRSTYYKRLNVLTKTTSDELKDYLGRPGNVTVHWLDNFARTFARQGIYLDREQFVSML